MWSWLGRTVHRCSGSVMVLFRFVRKFGCSIGSAGDGWVC